jgi:ABC-2 type transport system ATP-binding protein
MTVPRSARDTNGLLRQHTPIDDPSFTVEHLTLEDLVLAYMSRADPDPLPVLETTR